jgi:CDP-6-deoxy-D-xylo-4-hexulose-3-dehydrase
MQPAVGLAQLKKLPSFVKARQKNFKAIYEALKPFEDVLLLPRWEKDAHPSWFGFPIFVKEEAPFSRDEMVKFLESKRIMTRMMFGGNLIKQPAYRDIDRRVFGTLQNTDRVMNRLFWIGVYPGLTEAKLDHVIQTLTEFLKG